MNQQKQPLLPSQLQSALLTLIGASNPSDGMRSKGKKGTAKSGNTRRGSKHIQGRHFLGRRIYNVTPAQYRHQHMGKSKKA